MHNLLRSYRTWLALAGVAAAVLGVWWHLAPVGPLDPRYWTEPVVLRSVHMDDMPVVAVGGSRDGSRIAAACSKYVLNYKRGIDQTPKEVDARPVVVVVVEADGSQSFRDEYQTGSLALDIDVDSTTNPEHAMIAVANRGVYFRMNGRKELERDRSELMQAVQVRFSRDESRLFATGGHLCWPGCPIGESPLSIARFLVHRETRKVESSRNTDGIGVIGFAVSPDESAYTAVGVDSNYAKHYRRIVQNLPSDKPTLTAKDADLTWGSIAIKVWREDAVDSQSREPPTPLWQQLAPASPEGYWYGVPISCYHSSDGAELLVAYGSLSNSLRVAPIFIRDAWGFQLERIDIHDANSGKITRQFALPKDLSGPSNMTLVGAEREEVVILTPGGLWRKSVADTGEWRRFVIPKAGKLSCMKTTRDRRHLLVGDEAGNAYCLGWP